MPVTTSELAERVAILRRFRELLQEQKERLCSYLGVLDKQKALIAQGGVEELTAHVEFEEQIAADIFALQKSIEPMRPLYETAWLHHDIPDIAELNAALDSLKTEAARRITENKILLKSRMGEIRAELNAVETNPFKRGRHSVYADTAQPTLLDLQG